MRHDVPRRHPRLLDLPGCIILGGALSRLHWHRTIDLPFCTLTFFPATLAVTIQHSPMPQALAYLRFSEVAVVDVFINFLQNVPSNYRPMTYSHAPSTPYHVTTSYLCDISSHLTIRYHHIMRHQCYVRAYPIISHHALLSMIPSHQTPLIKQSQYPGIYAR